MAEGLKVNISGVEIFPLKQIADHRGKVMHFLKRSDSFYVDFGEAYFSVVNPGVVKGWKLHKRAVQSIVVVSGTMKFVLTDESQVDEIVLSPESQYALLRIPPNVYYSFKCESQSPAVLANISTISHDPEESVNKELNYFDSIYKWV